MVLVLHGGDLGAACCSSSWSGADGWWWGRAVVDVWVAGDVGEVGVIHRWMDGLVRVLCEEEIG